MPAFTHLDLTSKTARERDAGAAHPGGHEGLRSSASDAAR